MKKRQPHTELSLAMGLGEAVGMRAAEGMREVVRGFEACAEAVSRSKGGGRLREVKAEEGWSK